MESQKMQTSILLKPQPIGSWLVSNFSWKIDSWLDRTHSKSLMQLPFPKKSSLFTSQLMHTLAQTYSRKLSRLPRRTTLCLRRRHRYLQYCCQVRINLTKSLVQFFSEFVMNFYRNTISIFLTARRRGSKKTFVTLLGHYEKSCKFSNLHWTSLNLSMLNKFELVHAPKNQSPPPLKVQKESASCLHKF